MSRAALEARGLTWTPLGRSAPILDSIDLRIQEGERVLVAGASGAGKSTLLRALAGVLGEAESGDAAGEVLVGGDPIRPGDGRVGLLMQDPAASLVAGRVGRDVAFGPENLGVPRSEIHARVARALAEVGFPYRPEHRTAALSGGEAQRLALAGVLAMHPRVVLLDEPTAMLDDESAAQVREAVRSVVSDRTVAMVVVEHRLDRWLSPGIDLIDRLVVLGPGGIVADGAPESVLARHGHGLVDAGLWVPGAAPPMPATVRIPPPRHVDGGPGSVLTLDGVGLLRAPRRGLSITRPPAPTPALRDVDLDVPAGRMTAVRGRSGAGKSSLLSVAAGLERPTSGAVRAAPALAAGLDASPSAWTSTQLAARIAWVPQRASLTAVGLSVLDGLLATSRAVGQDDDDSSRRAEEIMAGLHLEGLETRNPHTLSGGQMRRLALASALIHGPSLLTLDEPTVGQDRHTWAAVAGVCAAAAGQGAAVLVGTHDDDLAAHADAVCVLDAGRRSGVGS